MDKLYTVSKKQDRELTMAQIMNSLLLNSDFLICWPNEDQSSYGIYKRTLRAPTKENTLALIAVDIGGKNTQEHTNMHDST